MTQNKDWNINSAVAFTGHRPDKITHFRDSLEAEKSIRKSLSTEIVKLYDEGFRTFLTGMAEGFDLWGASEFLKLKRHWERVKNQERDKELVEKNSEFRLDDEVFAIENDYFSGVKCKGRSFEGRLVCVVPFRRFERVHSPESKPLFDLILAQADEVIYLSEYYYHGVYEHRNNYLVDASSRILTYYEDIAGGTRYTINRAQKLSVPITNILSPKLF